MSDLKREVCPEHPGMILDEMFLKDRDIAKGDFAEAVSLSRKVLSEIIHGKAAITATSASKFAEVLGTTPELWLNLQKNYDLFKAQETLREENWKPTKTWCVVDSGPAANDKVMLRVKPSAIHAGALTVKS